MEINQVCEEAEKIANKYNPENISPFPFEKIQENCPDLVILSLSNLPDNISGAITFEKEKNKFVILINTNKPFTRQHFTTAHELGHYFLHKESIQKEEVIIDGDSSLDGAKALFRLDTAESSRIETEANNFAASLLMPTELVIKAWETINDIAEVAKIFNVSASAMSIRLERLKLIQ